MDNMNHLLFDFLDKHADMYEGKDAINPELYDLYKVKRGLRDKNGNGVVAGLTTISTIEAFDISGDQKVPCDGRLYYRGYDVRELVSKSARRSVRRRIRRSSWYLPRRKISIRSVVWVWGLMII